MQKVTIWNKMDVTEVDWQINVSDEGVIQAFIFNRTLVEMSPTEVVQLLADALVTGGEITAHNE